MRTLIPLLSTRLLFTQSEFTQNERSERLIMLDLLRLAVGAAALFFLPGYALLALAREQLDLDRIEAACVALGLSLAAVPLALYVSSLLGIQQGQTLVVGLLVLCAIVTVWDWRRSETIAYSSDPEKLVIYSALAVVALFTLVGRLWSVQDIHFPMWTDSYGHTVIAQLIVETGRIPSTYEPYAPIHEFTYHFGFHSLAAWFHWVTGLSVPQSMVSSGQILNALVVPTTYIFVQRLFNNRHAGLAAAVIAGFLSHMPSQFVNWGRYTQLDGQILLPVVMALHITILRPKMSAPHRLNHHLNQRWRSLLLITLAFVGLFFAHYRIFIFGALLAAILFVFTFVWPQTPQTVENSTHSRRRLVVDHLLIAAIGLLVLAPWIWRLAGGFGGNYARTVVGGYQEEVHGTYFGFALRDLTDYGAHGYLWAVAGLSALWGLWQRNRIVMILLLWIAVVFAAANLHLINLTPLYSNLIVILVLYLPVAALGGYLLAEVVSVLLHRIKVSRRQIPLLITGLLIVLAGIGVGAVRRDLDIVAPDNAFVRAGDLAAMQWVQQEVPVDSLFYIATGFWTPTVAHGLDAGYYLPLLAGRQTIMPLQNYASDGTMEYRIFVNQRLRDLAAAPDSHALWQQMNAYGITHLYIGVRDTELNPQTFLDNPNDFELLYDQGDVWVFAVRPPAQAVAHVSEKTEKQP